MKTSKIKDTRFKYPIWVMYGNLYIKAKNKKEADKKAKKWEKRRKPIPRLEDYNEPPMKLEFNTKI